MTGPAYHARTHLPGGTDPIPILSASRGIYISLFDGLQPANDTETTVSFSGSAQTNDTHPGGASVSSPFIGDVYSFNYGVDATTLHILVPGIYHAISSYWVPSTAFSAPTNFEVTVSGPLTDLLGMGNSPVVDTRRYTSTGSVSSTGNYVARAVTMFVVTSTLDCAISVHHTCGTLSDDSYAVLGVLRSSDI